MRTNYSSQREAIYKELMSTKEHPSARTVYEKLKPIFPNISLGTVYRNISKFKDEGKIISVCVSNGEERLDADTSDHAHFICEKCNAVYDLDQDTFSKLEKELSLNDFIVKRKSLVYYGICKHCSL